MRVIVCGGRDFSDKRYLYEKLNLLHAEHTITEVIEGGARGADYFAYQWSMLYQVPSTRETAEWARYGKRAGWIRNNRMADLNPDAVVAFDGGIGTDMMVSIAKARNIPVYDFRKVNDV